MQITCPPASDKRKRLLDICQKPFCAAFLDNEDDGPNFVAIRKEQDKLLLELAGYSAHADIRKVGLLHPHTHIFSPSICRAAGGVRSAPSS